MSIGSISHPSPLLPRLRSAGSNKILFALILPILFLAAFAVGQPTLVLDDDSMMRREGSPALPRPSELGAPAWMFIENTGQFDPQIRFAVIGLEGGLYLTQNGLWISHYQFLPAESSPPTSSSGIEATPYPGPYDSESGAYELHASIVQVNFLNASATTVLEGFDPIETTVSFFLGDDPARWASRPAVWAGIRYVEIFPGFDLEIDGRQGELTWRLIEKEQAPLLQAAPVPTEPQQQSDLSALFDLRISGATNLALEGSGIGVQTEAGGFLLPLLTFSPVADSGSALIMGSASIEGDVIRFSVLPKGTPSTPAPGDGAKSSLLGVRAAIRPWTAEAAGWTSQAATPADVLYSTYLGGRDTERSMGVALGPDGAIYLTGSTRSTNFPLAPGPFDPTCGGCPIFYDIYVTKISPDGSQRIYSTFIGGLDFDESRSIAVDASGAAYVTGHTDSADFPTTPGAFDEDKNGFGNNAVALKLSPSGSSLVYSTYIAGNSQGLDIEVNGTGEAYIVGQTTSLTFPTEGSLGPSNHGGWDAFALKLSAGGNQLIYSGYVGGNGADCETPGVFWECSLDLFEDGSIYLSGMTRSTNFPPSGGLAGSSYRGNQDAFVARVSPDGQQFVFSGYLGGSQQECFYGCDVNVGPGGVAYVVGSTLSGDFPTTAPPISNELGDWDIFAATFAPDGSGPLYANLIGGSMADFADAGFVNSAGDLFITGNTLSGRITGATGAYSDCASCSQGLPDAFLGRLSTSDNLLHYFTYLGGSSAEYAYAMTGDGADEVFVTGSTFSRDYPVTINAFQKILGGERDAFLTRLRASGGEPPPSPTPPPASTSRYWQKLDITGTRMDFERFRDLGCQEADRFSAHIVVILDFGAPGHMGGEFGTFLPANGTFVTLDDIQIGAKSFTQGFWQCALADSSDYLTLAIGTNNTGIAAFSPDLAGEHGAAWGEMIVDLHAWLIEPLCLNAEPRCNMRSRVSIVGANDIEAWKVRIFPPPTDPDDPATMEANPWAARSWADAFSAQTSLPYFNYGDCSNCASGGPTNDTQWYRDHYWYLSWGLANAWAIPEIYREDGKNAEQWQGLSKYSATCAAPCAPSQSDFQSPIIFLGSLTQFGACGPHGCPGTRNPPEAGWTQLFEALDADPDTRLPFLGWSTDITWEKN